MARGKKTKAATEVAAPSSQPHEQTHNVCSSKQTEVAKASSQAFHAFISDLEASPAPIVIGKQPVEPTPDKGNNIDVKGTLKLEMSDLIDVKAKLGFCLVGYIADMFPGFKDIRAMAHSWGTSFQQHATDSSRRSYFIVGRPLLLKNMPDCFEFKEDDIILTPVCTILPALPLECWNPKVLGKIRSAVGNPIAMDSLTSKMERVSYAHILVEVDASKSLIAASLDTSCQGPQTQTAAPSAPCNQTAPEKQSKEGEKAPQKAKKNQHQATKSLPTKPKVDAAGESQAPQEVRNKIQEQQGPAKPKQAWTVALQRIPSHQPENVPPSPADLSVSEDESSTATQHHMPGREFTKTVPKQKKVQEGINNLCLLGILETKLAASAIPRILHRSFPGWCQVNNFEMITGGHILVIWYPTIIDLQPKDISQQVIHCRVTRKSSQLSFSISFTYGLYSVVNRRSMWEKLSELGQNLNMHWLILGDFNCVRSPEEKLGVTPTWMPPSTGCFYTWYSNTESNPVWCKLDRVLRNNEWLEAGLHCNTHFPPQGCLSDHSPDFMAIVEHGWNSNVGGTAQFNLCRKLKALKGLLKAFNNLHFSHISVRANEADLALQDAQVQLESDPENANL
ncbi:hypothetical protein Salat_0203900 [Sesamum alatum]|uniref:Endonuclease/exonuclease/phosphatase domain-containing protein n=1 Tax=Sesamum alatum TaxID=300844 RepID=A0AAE2CYF3_9LAMI|nr:hypothetical protein Salat_0203900 [Sesamum alatum]